jgi:primosomal replication protein N
VNRFVLQAQLTERAALRYTPAGVPALDLRLAHASTLTEDGQPRQVAFEMRALALGAITRPIAELTLGGQAVFAGFMAAARNGRGLLFHVTSLDASA